MIPFSLNDEAFSLPSGLHEVTVKQFIGIAATPGDYYSILAHLSGINYDKWVDASFTPLEDQMLTEALDWIKEIKSLYDLQLPETIKIGNKILPVPKDISVLPNGAKLYFEQTVFPLCKITKRGDGEFLQGLSNEAIPYALAAYFQKPYQEKSFSTDAMDEMVKLCNECIITEALPVARFFLMKYFGFVKEKLNSHTQSQQSNQKPVLKRLQPLET